MINTSFHQDQSIFGTLGYDKHIWDFFWWLWFLGFDGKIFQFLVRPGNVGNYGFIFTLRHPLSLWKAKNDEKWHFWKFGFRAEVVSAEVFLGHTPRRSIFRAKVVSGQSISGPKWVSGQTGCEPFTNNPLDYFGHKDCIPAINLSRTLRKGDILELKVLAIENPESF